MSHRPERTEKICLNCGAELVGRYCHRCGQENIEPRESVWEVIQHFFYDITHFDSKFFNTLKYLIGRPGYLSKQFMIGRRASFLHPIKMYVFTSAVFFIVFFSLFTNEMVGLDGGIMVDSMNLKAAIDTPDLMAINSSLVPADSALASAGEDTSESQRVARARVGDNKNVGFSLDIGEFASKKEYDSAQATLPPSRRDGWLARQINYRRMELAEKYRDDPLRLFQNMFDTFIHLFPYMLFVSLPLYALFLKLLYIRRKKFYYVNHGIFLIHLYIFTFIWLLIFFGLYELNKVWGGGFGLIGFVQAALVVYGIYYALRAMHKFYEQGIGKTVLKFILLNFFSFISLIGLFALFLILAAFQI